MSDQKPDEPTYKLPPRPGEPFDVTAPLVRYGRAAANAPVLLEPSDDGYWTPWHIAQAALDAVREKGGEPANPLDNEHARRWRFLMSQIERGNNRIVGPEAPSEPTTLRDALAVASELEFRAESTRMDMAGYDACALKAAALLRALASSPVGPAEPTALRDAPSGFYVGGPYHDGTFSVCETATGRVIRKFREEADLLDRQLYKWSYCGMERFRVFAAGADAEPLASSPVGPAEPTARDFDAWWLSGECKEQWVKRWCRSAWDAALAAPVGPETDAPESDEITLPHWLVKGAEPAGPEIAAPTLRIGGLYNWKNQLERLVYVGLCEPRNGRWHQFELVDKRGAVWCEVLDGDLHMIEETPADEGSAGG